MATEHLDLHNFVKDACSAIVEEEMDIFEDIWEALSLQAVSFRQALGGTPPPRIVPAQAKRTLAAVDDLAPRDYQLPRIAATLMATALHFGTLSSSQRTKPNLKALLGGYCRYNNLTKSELDRLTSVLEPLLRHDFSAHPVAIDARERQYIVLLGPKKLPPCKLEGLKRYRSARTDYDIFLDEPQGVLLVRGEQPKLRPGRTDAFRILACLLERVSGTWDYRELWDRTRDDEWGHRSSEYVYQTINHIRRNLADALSRASKGRTETKKAREIVKKEWLRAPGSRVTVFADLKTCLIREAP